MNRLQLASLSILSTTSRRLQLASLSILSTTTVLLSTTLPSVSQQQPPDDAPRLRINPAIEKQMAKHFCVMFRQSKGVLTNEIYSTVYGWVGQYDEGLQQSIQRATILSGQGYSNASSSFMSDIGGLLNRMLPEQQRNLTKQFILKHYPKCKVRNKSK